MTRPGGVSPRSHSIHALSNFSGSGGGVSMPGRLPTYALPLAELVPSRSPLTLRGVLLDGDSFVVVLGLAALCVVMFPFTDAFRAGAVIAYPSSALLLLLALHHSRVHRTIFRAAVVILVVVGVGTVLSSVARLLDLGADRHMIAIASFLYALLFAFAFPSIVRRAFHHRDVSLNTLAAGIAAYLIIGLFFAAFDRGIAGVAGWEFFRDVVRPRPGDFMYFSFVTLTTVGYGDLAPYTDIARTASVVEAVLGQVFLVTAVARIVSLMGSRRSEPPTAPPLPHDLADEGPADRT